MSNYAVETLRRRALAAHLRVRKYSAKKTDKRASKKIEQENHTRQNMAHVKKTLLVDDLLKDFQQVETAARQFHYRMTFPWTDTGLRLLPTAAHEDYISRMGLYQEEALNLADEIVKAYPKMKQEAKKYLGTLYDESDYPPADKIRQYFDFDVVITPLPHYSNDVRLELSDDQAEMVQKETEARMKRMLEESMNEAWNRLYKTVQHIKERMDPENRFHYTTLDNAKELADLLPKLNIAQDPELDRLAAELKAGINYNPDMLRKDDDKKKHVADDMDKILSQMDAMNPNKGRAA